jgi:hypothetical protein
VPSFGRAGSQRHLQIAVNLDPGTLNRAIADVIGGEYSDGLVWRSPLENEGFREYRDESALRALGVDKLRVPLAHFWPVRGPVWDGLANLGRRRFILVEAKAHIPELASPGTKAMGKSLDQIEASLADVRQQLAPRCQNSWSQVFYQYANRLAFLYWLRVLNGKHAELVNLYFLDAFDVDSPHSVEEWKGALKLMKAQLGIANSRHPLFRHVHDVFLRTTELPDPSVRGPVLLR